MSAPLVQCWLVLPDGHTFDLRGTCTLGRASENALPLADDQVSRRHAIIQAQGENEFWLVDLGRKDIARSGADICDTMRDFMKEHVAEKPLPKPIVFKIDTIRVQGD